MPLQAEFEEREYETPLYNQLTYTNLVWSPGQVLEGRVGFDHARWAHALQVFELHGFRQPPPGFLLDEMYWYGPWLNLDRYRPPPTFELNLFIQAKRPEYLVKGTQKVRNQGLGAPYWRFRVEAGQQVLLEQLATAAGARALVCYASPAFHRLTQLDHHTRNGSIVDESTFPEAGALRGHQSWNYNAPGGTGVANEAPEFVEGEGLHSRIHRLVGEAERQGDTGAARSLEMLAVAARAAARSVEEHRPERYALFGSKVRRIEEALDAMPSESGNQIKDYLVVQTFCWTFGLKWFSLGM